MIIISQAKLMEVITKLILDEKEIFKDRARQRLLLIMVTSFRRVN